MYTSQYGSTESFTAQQPPFSAMPPGQPAPGLPEPYMPPGMPARPRPYATGDDRLISDIKESVIKEVHAYDYYTKLAPMARDEQDRRTILRIRNDEIKHYRWFSAILQRLGAEQPEIPPGASPRNFEEGVRESIRDELDDAAFYQNIAYRARDRSIEMHFLHAAQDEQRHAAWFQSMLLAPQAAPFR